MSTDAPFSYSSAIQDLRHLRVENEQKDEDENAATTTSSVSKSRKLALMHRLQEGGSSGGSGGNGGTQSSTVDQCVFQSIQIDKTFDFADKLPEDPDDEAVSGADAKGSGVRKNGGKGGSSSSLINRRSEKPFEISIPLSSDRVKLSEVKQSLKAEYGARYCEALGVAPTHQNIALIHKNMPLEKCRLTQVFQPGLGRGERRNHVAIQPAYHAGPKHHAPVKSHVMPFEVLPKQTMTEREQHQQQQQSVMQANGGARQPHFENYKEKFVFPYNLGERFEVKAPPVDETNLGASGEPGESESRGGSASQRGGTTRDRSHLLGGPRSASGSETDSNAGGAPPNANPHSGIFEGHHLSTMKRLKVHDSMLAKLASTQKAGLDPELMNQAAANQQSKGRQHARQLEALLEGESGKSPNVAKPPPGGPSSQKPIAGRRSLNQQRSSSSATANEGAAGSSSEKPQRGASPTTHEQFNGKFVGKDHIDAAIQRELDQQYISFDTSEIKAVQQQFVSDFPFERFGNDADAITNVNRAKAFLVSQNIVQSAVLLLDFLFTAYVAPLSPLHASTVTPSKKDDLFVELYSALVTISQKKIGKAHFSMEIPLLILMLRVVVETEFSARFPTFLQCNAGRQVLHKMDSFAMAIMDPLQMMSRIPVIESTPQALKVLHSKRLPPRFTPMATTPMTQFILGDNITSTKSKALARPHPLAAEGLEELKMHLTPMVRSRLLAVVVEKKMQIGSK